MRSLDDKPIFANTVVGQGIHNGIVNVTLGAFLFSPSADGKLIEADPVIVARLRMDVLCARQLVDNLAAVLKSFDEAVEAARSAALKVDGDESGKAPS